MGWMSSASMSANLSIGKSLPAVKGAYDLLAAGFVQCWKVPE